MRTRRLGLPAAAGRPHVNRLYPTAFHHQMRADEALAIRPPTAPSGEPDVIQLGRAQPEAKGHRGAVRVAQIGLPPPGHDLAQTIARECVAVLKAPPGRSHPIPGPDVERNRKKPTAKVGDPLRSQ